MKNELSVTLIVCAIIFSGIGVLAFETMNSQTMSPVSMEFTPPKSNDVKVVTNEDPSVEYLSKNPQITNTPLNDGTTSVKTIVGMTIPENNKHPWGFVEGQVSNPAPGHPVIIQFFRSFDGLPVHVAQVDLNPDNSYNYRFRVLSIDDGITTHLFEGDYFVKIFKTVITPGLA